MLPLQCHRWSSFRQPISAHSSSLTTPPFRGKSCNVVATNGNKLHESFRCDGQSHVGQKAGQRANRVSDILGLAPDWISKYAMYAVTMANLLYRLKTTNLREICMRDPTLNFDPSAVGRNVFQTVNSENVVCAETEWLHRESTAGPIMR